MILMTLLTLAVIALAWSNGANDNFKGVATLYGSGTAGFRPALIWATAATLAGSLVSIVFAQALVKTFSGHGLISGGLIDSSMLAAVGLAGAITIMFATILGMPTSTTHALTGALVGAAIVADPGGVNWSILVTKFAQPLLLSPVLAIGLTVIVYVVMRRIRFATGIERQTCLCIGEGAPQPVTVGIDGAMAFIDSPIAGATVTMADSDRCVERYQGQVIGIEAQTVVDSMHYLSGAAVCFARAVNDTPKIAALLLVAGAAGGVMSTTTVLVMVTMAMVIGGVVQARKVAETMSNRITNLNTGQGLTANMVTAALVLGASRMGVPVSTTHVSCGTIFGIGAVNGRRDWKTIAQILVAWFSTLPLGFVLGAGFNWALHQMGVWT